MKFNGKGSLELQQEVSALTTLIKDSGEHEHSSVANGLSAGFESLNVGDLSDLETHTESSESELSSVLGLSVSDEAFAGQLEEGFNHVGFENDSTVTRAQIEAGAVIHTIARQDPAAYAKMAVSSEAHADAGSELLEASVGLSQSEVMDAINAAGMEAFEPQSLGELIPQSIAFNVRAARQHSVAELFYPTITVPPSKSGYKITARRVVRMDDTKHSRNKSFDQKKISVLEAIRRPEILMYDSTQLVPRYSADAETNAKWFADLPSRTRNVGPVEVTTKPLAFGESIDLLGISDNDELIGADLQDQTDVLDRTISLEALYPSVTYMDGTTEVTEDFRLQTLKMPKTGFLQARQGHWQDLELNFRTEEFILKPGLKTLDGSVSGLDNALGLTDDGLQVVISIRVTGEANMESSMTSLQKPTIKVERVFDMNDPDNPKPVDAEDPKFKAIVAKLTLDVKGYDVDANRTNSNLRAGGLQISAEEFSYIYQMKVDSPILLKKPIGKSDAVVDLKDLITVARLRSSLKAIDELKNYAEHLSIAADSHNWDAAVEGIGRYYVRPVFIEMDLDVAARLTSITSHERSADVKAVLTDALRELAYTAYTRSNYNQVAESMDDTLPSKPLLKIATNDNVSQHMMVTGDPRTASIGFKTKFATTNHPWLAASEQEAIDGRIVIQFGLETMKPMHPLESGYHLWMPELVSNLDRQKNGGIATEISVTPRERHINVCPVMMVINVKNLDNALRMGEDASATSTP